MLEKKYKLLKIQPLYIQLQILEEISFQDLLSSFGMSKQKMKHYVYQFQGKTYSNIHTILPKSKIIIPLSVEKHDYICIDAPIEILYEDMFCVIVNKPSGILVHPDGQCLDSLQTRLNAHLKQENWPYGAQAIHRIDRETSGLVLFSKFPFFQSLFDTMMQQHQYTKEYYCLVQGNTHFKNTPCDLSIARDRHHASKMRISKRGKEAHSIFTTIQNFQNESLVKAQIITGRKHQIRVHLQALGHPICNDPLYGSIEDKRKLCLQNHYLSFIHPITKESLCFDLDVDPRFQINPIK